ncbi:MAG: hypothetical protein M1383_06250 [Patescibacteria group bacterium]|nr:hypothetical protein [Patescibacteria group bacterium]
MAAKSKSSKNTVFGKVQKEVASVETYGVSMPSGYQFNYLSILNKIDLYFASRFLKGQYDSENFKKLFINISKYRVNTATKSVNIGTKNVKIRSANGQYYHAWFFEHELRDWMRENGWGKMFNDICSKWPRYGSVIVKDVNGNPVLMQLRNIIWDMTLNSMMASTFIDEKHIYNFDEFYEAGKKYGWDNVEQVMDMYEKQKLEEIQVIERYGYVPGDELTENPQLPTDLVKARTIITGMEWYQQESGRNTQNRKNIKSKPEVLESIKIQKPPYRKLDWEEEENRGLGVGVMEDLFQHQEYHNDVTHLERKSLHWSSKKFFNSRDPEAPSNLFSQATNGTVFNLKSELTQVDMAERNLPQYNLVFNRIKDSADNNAFTHEIVTGEAMGSGVPFRLGALLSNAVNTHYAFKRENLGLFIEDIIYDFVVPQFKKEKRGEHDFIFSGDRDQLEQAREFMIAAYMDEMVKKHEKKYGAVPSLAAFDRELQKVTQMVERRDQISMTLPAGFYDDIKEKVKVDVSGDSTDSVDMESLGNILKIVLEAGPALQQNETAMRLLEQIANEAGQSPIKLFGIKTKAAAPNNMGGAAPAPAAAAIAKAADMPQTEGLPQ